MPHDESFLDRKKRLRALFTAMLTAFGRKDFDAFAPFVADDALFEWPYPPLQDWRGSMRGRAPFIEAAIIGMADSDPYAYTIEAIHDQVEPDALIAEYTSHSFYHPRAMPYSNKYLSLVRYDGDQVVYWKEYVNPLIIRQVYGDEFFNAAAATGIPA